jgi:hypothetical protein
VYCTYRLDTYHTMHLMLVQYHTRTSPKAKPGQRKHHQGRICTIQVQVLYLYTIHRALPSTSPVYPTPAEVGSDQFSLVYTVPCTRQHVRAKLHGTRRG